MSTDYFFASYARSDNNDRLVSRFVRRFREELRGIAGLGLTDDELDQIGFFDISTIETGDDWRRALGEGLRDCRVCLCLCSPTYFNRVACGKEFQVFSDRRAAWASQPGNQNRVARVIVPVLWTLSDDPLPTCMSALQDKTDAFPSTYVRLGLRKLTERNGVAFRDTVSELAKIAWRAVQEVRLPPLPAIPDFDTVESPFHQPTLYGLTLLVMHPAGHAWLPFGRRPSAIGMAEAVASLLGRRMRPLRNDATVSDALKAATAYREAVIIMASPDALLSPAARATLAALNAQGGENYAVLVAWEEGRTDAKAAAVAGAVEAASPTAPGAESLPHDLFSITSPGRLSHQLEVTFEALRQRLVTRDPAVRATNADLERAAADRGIPIDRAPTLTNATGAMP